MVVTPDICSCFQGPIVRISPHEVHINDPEYFSQLYSFSLRLDKCGWYYNFAASPTAGFSTAPFELHRIRRGALAKYFSMSNVARLEPLIQDCVTRLCSRLEEHRKEGTIVDLSSAYRCFASDVIMEYALPQSRRLLDSPDFAASYHRVVRNLGRTGLWNRQFPFIIPFFRAVPRWIIAKLDPGPALSLADFQIVSSSNSLYLTMCLHKRTTKSLRDNAFSIIASGCRNESVEAKATVLRELHQSDLPDSEKSIQRFIEEAQTLLVAGSETTGNTLTLTTFYLLADPNKAGKLKQELAQVKKDPDSPLVYHDLQRLPYLTASITEGLRISSSVAGRLPRINPHAAMNYNDFVIPAGVALSMSIRDVNLNETIFPNADHFIPERWLGDSEKRQVLERYMVAFGRGPRNCIGMNLALVELYLVIGNMFRDYNMKPAETREEDLKITHDFFSPFGPAISKGLRVKVE